MCQTLMEIQARCDASARKEILERYGFDDGPVEELEGSSVVLGGSMGGREAVLKITPAWQRPPRPTIGAEPGQVLAEMDFVRFLAERGLPVARPLPSRAGLWAEVLDVGDNACLVASVTEKAQGMMFPDEDLVVFPDEVLREWGRVQGRLSLLAEGYVPGRGVPERLPWSCDGHLALEDFLTTPQPRITALRDSYVSELGSLPRDPASFGMVHGDFHHGNWFWDGKRLTVFDFDAAHRSWYEIEPATSLYNCLPMPRSKVEERRLYALDFLRKYLEGYRQLRPYGAGSILRLPFWLKYIELLSYGYLLKNSQPPVSEGRLALLELYRSRLEGGVPVVEFREGDLESLC
jgi:Ser/Thr protein kinase RdoA (MazF antagonist)